MKLKLIIILFIILSLPVSAAPLRDPIEIINKVNANFLKVKDATADFTLHFNLYLFGCASSRRLSGSGSFKAPDKIKFTIDKAAYFAEGNRIRKIDEKGNKFHIRLVNATDASQGYNPGIIIHNFKLKTIKDNDKEIIIEGIPKAGVLNNTEKVIFYIDPKRYLLQKFHALLKNKYLSGTVYIDYKNIKGLWVPAGCHGRTAIELQTNALIGVGFKLEEKNLKINAGLPNEFFDPGF